MTEHRSNEIGAGEGNRTLTTSLEGWGSTIELHPQNEFLNFDINLNNAKTYFCKTNKILPKLQSVTINLN